LDHLLSKEHTLEPQLITRSWWCWVLKGGTSQQCSCLSAWCGACRVGVGGGGLGQTRYWVLESQAPTVLGVGSADRTDLPGCGHGFVAVRGGGLVVLLLTGCLCLVVVGGSMVRGGGVW